MSRCVSPWGSRELLLQRDRESWLWLRGLGRTAPGTQKAPGLAPGPLLPLLQLGPSPAHGTFLSASCDGPSFPPWPPEVRVHRPQPSDLSSTPALSNSCTHCPARPFCLVHPRASCQRPALPPAASRPSLPPSCSGPSRTAGLDTGLLPHPHLIRQQTAFAPPAKHSECCLRPPCPSLPGLPYTLSTQEQNDLKRGRSRH